MTRVVLLVGVALAASSMGLGSLRTNRVRVQQSDREPVSTNRPPGGKELSAPLPEDAWQFAIFGDRTGGPPEGIEILRAAVREANLFDPDLSMTVGDLIQGYNQTPAWLDQMREFTTVMDALLRPWFPVAGNHDVYWRGPSDQRPAGEHETNYETHFGPLWYRFEHKGSGFIVLYTDEGDLTDGSKGFRKPRHLQLSEEQLDWLAESIEVFSDQSHVFVFVHHPRWRDSYEGSNWDDAHAILKRNGNVRAVFAGHIHRSTYSGIRDGIEYLTLGATGASKYPDFLEAGYVHHFNIVTVRPTGITHALVPVGQTMDPRSLTDAQLARLDRRMKDTQITLGRPIVIRGDGSADSTLRVRIDNPLDSRVHATTRLDGPPTGWFAQPDHQHSDIEAGQSVELEFAVRAAAGSGRPPEVVVELEERREVLLRYPPRRLPIDVELDELPDGVFEARDAVLELDGDGDTVDFGITSPPDGPLTVEVWIQADSLAGRTPIVAKSENSEFYLFASNGKPSFGVHVGGRYYDATAPERISTDRWTHLTGEFDGESVCIAIDGTFVAETSLPKPVHGASRSRNPFPLFVGADPNRSGNPVDFFDGQIDELRISTNSRYGGVSFEPSRRFEPDDATWLLAHFDRDIGPFSPDHSSRRAAGRHRGDAATTLRAISSSSAEQ